MRPKLSILDGRRPASPSRPRFLPTTREDMRARGVEQLDILIVTGDAYVDHPAFGPVLVARFLEARGYSVGIVAQPRWDDPEDIALIQARLVCGLLRAEHAGLSFDEIVIKTHGDTATTQLFDEDWPAGAWVLAVEATHTAGSRCVQMNRADGCTEAIVSTARP